MLQPRKPLDLSGANEILKNERPPLNLSGAESILKKKDNSNGIAPETKSASVPKTGSSAGKNSQGFPEIDTNSVAPGMGAQPVSNEKVKSDKIKALETSFYEATKNNNDDAVAEQRTQEAIKKEGFWNTIKDVSKKAYNRLLDGASAITQDDFYSKELRISEDPLDAEKKQVQKQALKNKEKLTPEQVNTKAAELYKQKEKDNLFIDRANSFLDDLDPKDKELLRQDRVLKTNHLQESNAKKLKVVAAMQSVGNEKIKDYQSVEKEIKDLRKSNQAVPEELVSRYNALGTEIKTIGANIDKYQNEILKNKSDLGTAQEELDLFNREYGDIKNFVGNLSVATKDLANGLMGGYLWFGNTMAGLAGKHNDKDYNEAMNIATKRVSDQSKSNEKEREKLRKPVENIESVEGFVNYASDLMANQIPNLVATSTGARGLTLIGTASAGQKFSEMNEEVREGNAKYSPSQMAFAPLLYGGAEVISEIPTLSILKKGGRVLESVAKNETQLVAKTAKEKAIEWAKDYGVDMSKEMAGEQFTNFAQNFNDKFVLGKDTVGLLDNTGQVFKDTFTLTSMLKAAPHVFGAVVKPFQSRNELGILDENSRRIIEFSRQLDTEGLSSTEKSVIQKQIDKATADSAAIMDKTIGKINDMPGRLYEEVVSLNQQAGEIKAQAKEIYDGKLSNKEDLLKGLSEDLKAIQDKRTAIIEGKTTEVDVLPLKEQEKIKKQAMESLVTELNPDGSKNITITNEQVVERANELLKESDANENNKTQTSLPSSQEEAAPSVTNKQNENFLSDQKTENKEETTTETSLNNNNENIVSDSRKVSEHIDDNGVYFYDGEKGELKTEGQQVVFETKDKIIELGNVDDVSDLSLNDLGVEKEEELNIVLNDDNSFSINSKEYVNRYSNPESAINQDKEGNYSVTLETPNGKKRTFRGQQAEVIVYQMKLKNFEQNGTKEEINRAIEITDEAIRIERETSKTSRERKIKSTRPIKEKLVNETVPPTNTVIDGNLQHGIGIVGENGTTTQTAEENTSTEKIPTAVDDGSSESQNDVSDKKETGTAKKSGKSAEERIKIANAKIDDIANALKGIDEIFGIRIKVDDVDGLNKNGIDIIDVIARVAKQAVAAGIHVDEAINKTVEHLKKSFDFEVDVNEVKDRINTSKDDNFKRKPGKKSLLNRLTEGGNPDVITNALKELGTDYHVRNQKEAHEDAIAFIEKVGVANALNAVRQGLVANMDLKMLIYDEAITQLKEEISNEIERNPEDREALIEQFQQVSDEFDKLARDAGQGISILNFIYNKNQDLKYSLSRQIAEYKKNSPDGKIPDDVKAKFEEIDAKLKDVESKLKEAEKRAKKAEEELAVKNIQEDIKRKKQLANKNKSGLTPKEQARKKELRNKFFGRLNDATSVITMLADPEFREYLGLTFKQAKGDFSNFSKKIIDELGKGAKAHLPQLFEEAEKSKNTSNNQTITIGKDGKIKIPAQMLRDYVEAGETDINTIAHKIKETIYEEYPDVDLRDIRDALTGYGKQINPNKDEITAKVNRLKEYGRLLSAFEDVLNRKMPKKSGLVREKTEQKSRDLRKKINRLAKELELETIDPATQWATAIDKVKSSLKNQIEDLDQQIANGEKRKVERTYTPLDAEAEALKSERDAKRKLLDELAGKPELTPQQKIANAEKSLEKSIEKLQKEIDENDIAFKEKPTPVTSVKIEILKAKKKTLLETRKQLRDQAGLTEQQRLKTAKTRVKNQIEDLKERIANRDFAKKESTPILSDNELNVLRAEKEALYEEYEKQKYIQELAERTTFRKYMDAFLEATALTRAIKASLDLGLIGIQLRGFTYAELWRNPMDLGRKFAKLFGAIGSQKKTNKAMSLLTGHPMYALAKKLDIGITHPDLRNEVREEMASGNLLHVAWNIPVIAANMAGKTNLTEAKRKSLGDTFIDGFKKQINKISKNYQLEIKDKEKFSRAEQWKNMNVFEAVERGLSTYGNQMRFEEFVRGVERLKTDGKDEINHPEDYEALASYIRTFSGRANPAGLKMNQKALNVFFFSFKNAVSVFQQLNPYYLFYDLNKSNLKNGQFKPTVAGKMAMATMFKSVASTAATMLFMMAGYNAFKDDDDDEMTIENDPRSSDFGKLKIGNLRYDPWGGYVPLITLYARLLTEETKKSDGTIEKLGSKPFGIEDRGDAAGNFLKNKFSPGFQMFYHYINSKEKMNKQTGEIERVNSFGQTLSEDEAFSMYPIFLGSVKDAAEKDPSGVKSFLTAYSVLGLGNVQDYESKTKKNKTKKFNPEEGFKEIEPKELKEID